MNASASARLPLREGVHDLWIAPPGQVAALDALRATAILMVITGHFAVIGGQVFVHRAAVFRTLPFWFGWTGVDLFFVLSGLLIGRQLWRELGRNGTIDVRVFVLRRGFRIWPLYFTAALLSPILTATWSYRWGDWVFLSNYVGGRIEGGWSLSTEEHFYIIAPILLLIGGRVLRPRAWLATIPAALALVALARWRTGAALLRSGMSVHDVKQAMYTPFHLHNEGLAIGLLIALAAVHFPNWLSGAPAHRRRTAGLALGAVLVAVTLRTANGVVFPFLSLALIYGAVTVALLAIGPDRLRLLKARPFYVISRLSYGMYLNHFAVLRWVSPSVAVAVRRSGGEGVGTIAVALGVTVLSSAAIASITFVLIERPFLVLRDRVLHRAFAARTMPADMQLKPVVPGAR